MQAAGVNQVQQGALDAVDNLPSAGVSPHVRGKAVRFGLRVVVLCAVAPVIGAYCLTKPEVVRHMIIESDKTYMMMLAGVGVALLSAAAKEISERVCTRPGGFIFERVCTMLDAYERHAANNIPDRSDEVRQVV